MYTLYYSPYLILFGQLLIGTTSARMASSVGEISRVYETDEITQKLGIVGLMTMAGSVLRPLKVMIMRTLLRQPHLE